MINKRFLSFTYESLGERALSVSEINTLKRAGLLRESTRHLTADPSILGKIVALLPRKRAKSLTYDQVSKIAKQMTPLTSVEKRAIEFASDKAGEYIKGLKDDMIKDVGVSAVRSEGAALRGIREGLSEALVERKTTSQFASDLFHTFDDRNRDWRRLAHTEINDSIQHGIYNEILEQSDSEQLISKVPNPDACPHCKRVYLKEDGITPKVFRLKDLADNNIGLKARDWKPTIGSVHPWCNCQLIVIPDGFDFVLNEDKQAVLSFTGKTAKPVRKSEISETGMCKGDSDA